MIAAQQINIPSYFLMDLEDLNKEFNLLMFLDSKPTFNNDLVYLSIQNIPVVKKCIDEWFSNPSISRNLGISVEDTSYLLFDVMPIDTPLESPWSIKIILSCSNIKEIDDFLYNDRMLSELRDYKIEKLGIKKGE
jgi:hypothetical protein